MNDWELTAIQKQDHPVNLINVIHRSEMRSTSTIQMPAINQGTGYHGPLSRVIAVIITSQ